MLENQLRDDLSDNAQRWVDLILDRITVELPDLVVGDESIALAVASTRALLVEFAAVLTNDELVLASGELEYHAPPAALGFARHLARRGVRLADVLRSYRLGHELLFERGASLVTGFEQNTPVANRIGLLMFRFADDVSREVADVFDRERESVLRGAIARRERLVTALLSGAQVKLGAAEQTLGRRMSGTHLALVGWRPDGEAEPDTVSAAMRPLIEAVSLDSPLVIFGAAGDVYAWATPSDKALTGAAVPPQLVSRLRRDGIRVAIGAPGKGIKGFVASRRQADTARTVAVLRPEAIITRYDDVALLALLLRDHAAAQTFAAEELGGLAGAGRQLTLLRDTVRVYFACHLDATSTARKLGVHRNTIARRLRKAEELIGHPLERRSSEIGAALAILEAPSPE